MVVVDADIIIMVLRGNQYAANYLKEEVGAWQIVLSCITVTEIMQGAKDKQDLQRINKFLNQYIVVPIQLEISEIFTNLVNKFVLSHDTGIADTLVAATALHYNLPLLTNNQKHFKHIPNLQLVKHNIPQSNNSGGLLGLFS